MEKDGVRVVALVREMVLALVDDASGVRVTGDEKNGCVVVHVRVSRDDVGKVIGRNGRIARSLRTIVGAVSIKHRVRCDLNIDDAQEGMAG